MGLSRLDALVIQTNGDDVKVEVVGPGKTGKFGTWVMLYRDGDVHRPIVNTELVFDSEENARKFGDDLVAEVRAMDLLKGK